MPRTFEVVRRVAPRAHPSYIAGFEQGDALLLGHGITTPARLAHFLAQVLHETGGLEIQWENMSYSGQRLQQVFGAGRHSAGITPGEAQALAHRPEAIAERVYGLGNSRKASALGNTRPGDGFRYRGGGLMQTTGRANYRRMGQKCGVDFESQPDLVLAPEHALKPALCEWTEARLNAFADRDDILSISRAINMGNPRASRLPNGMADRIAWYTKVRPLIDRIEFAAAAGEPAPPVVPMQPSPAEETLTGRSIAAIIVAQILRFGDRGSDVQAVQRALARLGYGLSGTGNYGSNTRSAVADFQAKHGLEADGEVGPETAKAIDAVLASASGAARPDSPVAPHAGPERQPSPVASATESPSVASVSSALAPSIGDRILGRGDTGDLVREVQSALTKLGYELKGTGHYGPNTRSAVADFQAKHGLEVDGEVGPETARAIDAVLASADVTGKPALPADAPPPLPDSPTPPPDGTPAPLPVSLTLAAGLGDRILRMGDTDDLVRAVQSALAKLGYELTGTGNYHPDMRSAVADFQAKHGLEVNGEVGPATARAIDAVLASADATGKPAVASDAPSPLPGSPTPPPGDTPASLPASPTLAALLGDRILRMGDTGDLVREVQSALAKLGYGLTKTGNYDRDSQGAVAGFQAKHGLEVDGEVGPATARAIDAVLASADATGKPADAADVPVVPVTPGGMLSPGDPAQSRLTALLGDQSLRIGDEGDLVREFQLALARLGYQLKGTGTFGGATDTAVAHFQQSRGLEVDGEIGPQTAAAIDAALADGGSTSTPTGKQSPAGPLDGGANRADQPIWLLEGLKWLNTREAPGAADNPDIIGWVPAEGGTIPKDYRSDSIPWCALYANMVLTKVGLPGTESLRALDWADWGIKLAGPAVGAFAPMKRKGGGHIAIVVGRDQDNRLMLLGGNQDDAVNIAPYPANRPLSFRWPKEVPAPVSTGFNSLPLVPSASRRSSVKES